MQRLRCGHPAAAPCRASLYTSMPSNTCVASRLSRGDRCVSRLMMTTCRALCTTAQSRTKRKVLRAVFSPTKQVYDLHQSNSWLQHIGLGAYHSGLEISGVEYTFSEAGVGQHPPRQIAGDGVSFKTTEAGGLILFCVRVLTFFSLLVRKAGVLPVYHGRGEAWLIFCLDL